MDTRSSRKRKTNVPLNLPKVGIETRDMACSPIPEIVSPEVSPAPAPESAHESVNSVDVTRDALPKIRVVDLDRSAKKTVKVEFVASRVNGVVSITAHRVEVKFSVSNTDWAIFFKKEKDKKFFASWRIPRKISATLWKIVASLNWICSRSDSDEKMDQQIVKRWRRKGESFDCEGQAWDWDEVADHYWLPLITIPAEGATVTTAVDVDLELVVEQIHGFRLRQSFSYDFHEPNKDSDLVFRFNGGDVYINCSYLALISDYFSATKDRLSTMKKNENGFPFEEMDVDMDEFVELMEVVYPSSRTVTDENVSFVLRLADRFLFDGVLRECEKFLRSTSSKTDISVKLLWSSEYVMNDLQEWCLSQFKTSEEITKVMKCGVYKELKKNGKIMTALFEKSAAINMKSNK